METKIRAAIKWLGSKWTLGLTLAVFTAETGYLAITSRFPMAYDEAWHLGQIRFFSHHLNPIITSQPPSTYKFGNFIQDPSFLYHYLMSFPYRLIELFTSSLEIQVIYLRLIDVALAVASLIVIKKLLRAINLSNALANVIVLCFALTPVFTALSAQISYDNLLILVVSLSAYETVLLLQEFDKEIYNAPRLMALISLCLFSSEVKYAYLPVFLGILILLVWKIAVCWRRDVGRMKAGFKKTFVAAGKYSRFAIVLAVLLGGFLFARIYGVNTIKYHHPVSPCSQVLSVKDCRQYYSYNNLYIDKQQRLAGLNPSTMNVFEYSRYWFLLNVVEIFGTVLPLHGYHSVNPFFFIIVTLIGTVALCCALKNLKAINKNNKYLAALLFVGFVYTLTLFVKSYSAYLDLGKVTAAAGRYLVPVLVYFYALLGLGFRYALAKLAAPKKRPSFRRVASPYTPNAIPLIADLQDAWKAIRSRFLPESTIKFGLALVIIISFLYFGGLMQYTSNIDPIYGRLSPYNNFILQPI